MSDESDLLRRAAAKVREVAVGTRPAPWWPHERGHLTDAAAVTSGVGALVFAADHDADVAWSALVSPAIAEPLAAWLELEAGWDTEASSHSLDFARALLGEDPS